MRQWVRLAWAMWFSGLFLGGGEIPTSIVDWAEAHDLPLLPHVAAIGWIQARAVMVLLLMTVLGRVAPRVRVDQGTEFVWKWCLPASVFGFVIYWILRLGAEVAP